MFAQATLSRSSCAKRAVHNSVCAIIESIVALSSSRLTVLSVVAVVKPLGTRSMLPLKQHGYSEGVNDVRKTLANLHTVLLDLYSGLLHSDAAI